MSFVRLRRLRVSNTVRNWVSETNLAAKDLIMPYFVIEGRDKRTAIGSMPGISRLSVDNLIRDVKKTRDLGIKAVLLFGVSDKKDPRGLVGYRKAGVVQKAVGEIKRNVKEMIVITDVCLCGHTTHGHCGIVKAQSSKLKAQSYVIDNDETIKILAKIALSHAEAGADFVAPSAMMDGQVKTIRAALDVNGFSDVGILAYSAKYASSFYWPFREAMGSGPRFGDRKSYQMDFRNSDEALREIEQDIEEGADIVMVKPALAYLDIIYRAKEKFNIPIAAYNVSGEYALIKAQSSRLRQGFGGQAKLKAQREEVENKLILEILTGIKRAGADLIITYHANEVAKWLKTS